MALRRVHAAITPEMVESAAEHGIDLSDTSVVTVLVPPIICNKFDGDYSILGGPVCKSIGIRYEQDAWCHNPDYVVWHRQPLLQTKLHHKRNGLPYLLLVPDAVVQQRQLKSVHAHSLKPYSDAEAMELLKLKWQWHDPESRFFTLAEECYSMATSVSPLPGLSADSVATSYLESIDTEIDTNLIIWGRVSKVIGYGFFFA